MPLASGGKRAILVLALAVAAATLLVFLLGASKGGVKQVRGTRAGGLDAGNIIGGRYPLRRGESFMIALDYIKNVWNQPILVESVRPESSSPALRVTRGRIWMVPRHAHLTLPNGWPGWPPKHLPTKPGRGLPKSWVQPHPNVLSLPTRQEIPPGRTAQLIYGAFLHAYPNAKTRITAIQIRFAQAGRRYVWTLPEPVQFGKTRH